MLKRNNQLLALAPRLPLNPTDKSSDHSRPPELSVPVQIAILPRSIALDLPEIDFNCILPSIIALNRTSSRCTSLYFYVAQEVMDNGFLINKFFGRLFLRQSRIKSCLWENLVPQHSILVMIFGLKMVSLLWKCSSLQYL